MAPTRANGKICYLEIPTTDVARSADFYKRIFGWGPDNAAMVTSRLMTRPAK